METARECARLITESRETIISEWENEVRKEIIGAGMSDSVALRDHLPELLDDIAAIFEEKEAEGFNHKTDKYERTFEKNKVHGQLRAATENYSIDQVILEYFILHRIITEKLQNQDLLTINIGNLLKYILERTVMQASAAFSISIQEMQDKLIGTLAHDIRNPLTTALSGTELLLNDPVQNERIISLIRRSLIRSIKLTEGLLDSISTKAGQGMMMNFTKGDYALVVKETCEESFDIYTKIVSCDIAQEPVDGTMDQVAIRRMLDNLISNAIKYGDAKSGVKVMLHATDDQVILQVHNQGNPIPPDQKNSIFEFLDISAEEIPRGKKSWGMGLTLVKLIADAHEGTVDVTSHEQEGTTFAVTLNRFPKHSGKVRMKRV